MARARRTGGGRAAGVACLLALAGLVASCAGYSIQENGTGDGFDVYRPEPYLERVPLVDQGQIVGYEFNVVYLPNYGKRYRVRSWTGFGASNIKFTFEDGWRLTGLHDQNKNTEVLKQLVDLTKHLIPANPFEIAKTDDAGLDGPTPGAKALDASAMPVLYRIVYDDCGRPTCDLVKLEVKPCVR